jgi:hypothetical protein
MYVAFLFQITKTNGGPHQPAPTPSPKCTTYNQKNKNTATMVPRRPSPSISFNLVDESYCCTSCDWSQSSQHGDMIYIGLTYYFFILLTILLQVAVQ